MEQSEYLEFNDMNPMEKSKTVAGRHALEQIVIDNKFMSETDLMMKIEEAGWTHVDTFKIPNGWNPISSKNSVKDPVCEEDGLAESILQYMHAIPAHPEQKISNGYVVCKFNVSPNCH